MIDENGLNSYDRAAIKIKQNRLNNIDENGLNSYQRAAIKSANTMKNTIDENGLNIYQKNKIKEVQTCLNTIDENGLNIYQQMSIKKYKNIDENGLNGHQRAFKKARQTMLNDIDENGLNGMQRKQLKTQQTYLQKYGVKNYFQTIEFKNNFKNIEWLNNFEAKRFATMKKNHTYKKSKQEDNCYKLLLNKFDKDDVIRQYKSKEYPFRCDLYIKSLKLYIECHFGQYHYNKPFKNSIEDLEEIEKLKNKSLELNFKGQRKLQYLNIIDTWTKRDVKKLQTFKRNKLNYKIFYKVEQFKNWLRNV